MTRKTEGGRGKRRIHRRHMSRRSLFVGVMLLAFFLLGMGIWRVLGDSDSGVGQGDGKGPSDAGGASLPGGSAGGMGTDEAATGGESSTETGNGSGANEGPGQAGQSGDTRYWESDRTLPEEAKELLASYQRAGNCTLAEADYLDLFGKTWGCVIQGDGWVDLCVVQEKDAGGSRARVTRMDPREWEGELDARGLAS